MSRKRRSIRVDSEVHSILVKIKGRMEQETGRTISVNEALWELLTEIEPAPL